MMTPVTHKAGGATNAPGSSENPWDTIQAIVAGTIGTKIQGRHIANHNLANRLFLANQSLGKTMGLSEEIMRQITPFPSPANNTFILNENPAVGELLAQLMANKPAAAQPAAPSVPPSQNQTPAPNPSWKRFIWSAIAAAGLATAGGTAVSLWPEASAPPPVTADYEVTAR